MRYRVGDRVKIVDNLHEHEFRIGEVVTIQTIEDEDYKASNGEDYWWVQDEELEAVPDNKPEVVTKNVRYRVGDRVRVVKNLSGHEFETGNIVTVESLDSDGDIYSASNGTDYWFIDDSEVELVSRTIRSIELRGDTPAIVWALRRYAEDLEAGRTPDTNYNDGALVIL